MAEVASYWLEDLQLRQMESTTREEYTRVLRRKVLPFLGLLRVEDVHAGIVDRYLKLLTVQYSASSARRAKGVLRQLMRWAVQNRVITSNPVDDTDPIPSDMPVFFVDMSAEQLRGLLELLAEWPGLHSRIRSGRRPDAGLVRDVMLLALGSSMRTGEILAVRRQDVVEIDGRLAVDVNGTIVSTLRPDGSYRKSTPKRARQARLIPLPTFASDVLRSRMDICLESREGYVFTTSRGTGYTVNNVDRVFRGFREFLPQEIAALGVDAERLSPRMFRKAAATTVARLGSAEISQHLLGHARLDTTERYYIKPHSRVEEDAARLLEACYQSAISA